MGYDDDDDGAQGVINGDVNCNHVGVHVECVDGSVDDACVDCNGPCVLIVFMMVIVMNEERDVVVEHVHGVGNYYDCLLMMCADKLS